MEREIWKAFSNYSSSALPLCVLPQPRGVTSLIKRARCQSHHSLGSIRLAGREVEAVELIKEDAKGPSPLLNSKHKYRDNGLY